MLARYRFLRSLQYASDCGTQALASAIIPFTFPPSQINAKYTSDQMIP